MLVHDLPTRTPRIVAIFSFRYDAHLVPAMLENVSPLVDGWIGFDDRSADVAFSDERSRRIQLLEAARGAGAQWVLALDPDERWESGLRWAMPFLLASSATAVSFQFRELYTPNHYRVDSNWGRQRRARLLRVPVGPITRPKAELHAPWVDYLAPGRVIRKPFALYHLKTISPQRRKARAELYERLDADHRYQPIGYQHLCDEAGLRLKRIGFARGYRPAHIDDGGLWMAPAPSG